MKSTQLVMGMPVSVEVVTDELGWAAQLIGEVFAWFREVDETFSTYKAASVISRLNRGELEAADAPPTVQRVLEVCEAMRERTEGYFDIRRDGRIDPSGLVKGWSIWEAAQLLDRADAGNYMIEAGGDLQARGLAEHGGPWRVGIRNPFRPSEIVKVLELSDGAVATSGTYERGEHIYDPHTGAAATAIASLTVVGPRIDEADAYATAAFAMGTRGAAWVGQQGLDAYQIKHDGTAAFTEGLTRYLAQ